MILEVSISPLGKKSLSKYVAEVIRVFDEEGLNYELNPMGTIIEGEWDEVMPAIKRAEERVFAIGAERVSIQIKIDDRRDKKVKKEEKVRSVKKKLEKE
ncbi:MAG: MTH1187 family thiamine-binding protein [Euryarchaeota archaeon]|nr:MTH1187 family thiamine-binding protein [Euryarchaeota archaeon]